MVNSESYNMNLVNIGIIFFLIIGNILNHLKNTYLNIL